MKLMSWITEQNLSTWNIQPDGRVVRVKLPRKLRGQQVRLVDYRITAYSRPFIYLSPNSGEAMRVVQ